MLKIAAPLRMLARLLERVRRFVWRFTGRPAGVHAIAMTAEGKVILVKLNYARGWRAPGGGMKDGEAPEVAILRELEEEIGMTSHGKLEELGPTTAAGENQNVFLVRDVAYRAKSSLEIRSVREFAFEDLPGDLAPSCRRFLNLARDRLQGPGEPR